MGKFDGILICTDLDGTLYRNDKSISIENKEAISHFKAEGGKFTFVTGRMPYYAVDVFEKVKPNAPVGCINGGGMYDYKAEEYIWYTELSKDVLELVRYVDDAVPQVGINISTLYKTCFYKDNASMEAFRKIAKLPEIFVHYNDITEPFGKILFSCNTEEDVQMLEKALKAHTMADVFNFVRSEQHLYEILPKGIGKGTVISKLAEHLRLDINKTIAIGDYNNDVSMLKAAGLGVAVSNACAEALAAADLVTVSNEEHAIAKVISDIENGCIRI